MFAFSLYRQVLCSGCHRSPSRKSILYRGWKTLSSTHNFVTASTVTKPSRSWLGLRPPHCRLMSTYPLNWDVQHIWISSNLDQNEHHPQGVNFNVGYVDTAHDLSVKEKLSLPVILALHGCPGSHEDLATFVKPYAKQGYRILLPNMPSFGVTTFIEETDQPFFRHSTEEQADFLLEFLSAVNVTKLRLVLGLSVAACPLTLMCAKVEAGTIESAAFICPIHGHKPPRGFEPLWMLERCGRWWYHGGIRRWLIVQMYKEFIAKKNDARDSNTEEVGAIIQTGYNMGFRYLPTLAIEVAHKHTPMLYVVTEDDPLIDAEESLEYAEMLGVGSRNFVKYDTQGNVVEEVQDRREGFGRGVMLEGTSHKPHLTEEYIPILHKEIDRMLDYLDKK